MQGHLKAAVPEPLLFFKNVNDVAENRSLYKLPYLQMLTQFNTHLKFGITLITQTVNFRSFPFLRLMFVSFALAILQLHRISGNCLVISGSPPRPQIGPSTNRLAGGSLQDCSTYTFWHWYTWVMLWLTT